MTQAVLWCPMHQLVLLNLVALMLLLYQMLQLPLMGRYNQLNHWHQ